MPSWTWSAGSPDASQAGRRPFSVGRLGWGTLRAMSMWKPHGLTTAQRDSLVLRRKARVRAKVDLPGVPEGTRGVVVLANGFNWRRYRVLFDNGVELADLDERHLVPTDRRGRPLAAPKA